MVFKRNCVLISYTVRGKRAHSDKVTNEQVEVPRQLNLLLEVDDFKIPLESHIQRLTKEDVMGWDDERAAEETTR
jgi:hypothetical protein